MPGISVTKQIASGVPRRGAATSSQPVSVTLRRIPYPYKAMLAICSDLDETPDRQTYWEIMRFLNTTKTTSMGPGVGLELGNSIYFDMPPNQFAYWNADDAGREMVRTLIQSGHIDCLHSYGDLATTRAHAGRALEELDRHGCRLEVWVDHSKAITNFGADIMCGQGDVQGSPAYHADLTTAYGIRFVWRGRVTSTIGQDVPPSLRQIFTPRHPIASTKTVTKEAVKRWLAAHGNKKYAMHGPNKVLRTDRLRDGRPVHEFLRTDGGYWGGVGEAATAAGFGEVLTRSFLDRIVDREAVCALYTHLGKIVDRKEILPQRTRAALRLLPEYARANRVLVTTTRRLLQYLRVRKLLHWRAEQQASALIIEVNCATDEVTARPPLDEKELQGITFVLPQARRVEVRLSTGAALAHTKTDVGGCTYVAIPWEPLTLPALGYSALNR
jgi:hypothetical protein